MFLNGTRFSASFASNSDESSGDWEKKMHELSEQLHSLLMQIKETKKNRPPVQVTVQKARPKVTVIRNVCCFLLKPARRTSRIFCSIFFKFIILRTFQGSAEQTPDNQYRFVATITLIQEGGKNILVDTGLGTDINARTQLMRSKLHRV